MRTAKLRLLSLERPEPSNSHPKTVLCKVTTGGLLYRNFGRHSPLG